LTALSVSLRNFALQRSIEPEAKGEAKRPNEHLPHAKSSQMLFFAIVTDKENGGKLCHQVSDLRQNHGHTELKYIPVALKLIRLRLLTELVLT
jgi:hypothetical protein